MKAILQHQLHHLPTKPGVYQFFDSEKKLLYVGKAKNLRQRVNSYFHHPTSLSPAKLAMVKKIKQLSLTTVTNEAEALLLEGNLIRQHLPPYNVVLKDDKSWLYLAIDYRQTYPTVSLVRRPIETGVRYFGPYPQANSIRYSFDLFKKLFSLKTCSNPPDRPCFASKLGRCLGHNLGTGNLIRYRNNLRLLERLIKGDTDQLLRDLKQQMTQAAQHHQFESAAKLRDQWLALKKITLKQSVIDLSRENYDVFGLASDQNGAAISRLIIRHGKLLDNEKFLLDQVSHLNEVEIMNEFLEQYYPQVTNRPKNAYLPAKSKTNQLAGVNFKLAQRGKKRALLKLAAASATTHLTNSGAAWERRAGRAQLGLAQLKKILGLKTELRRLEGYDISNLQGQTAVGSMVVALDGLPEPRAYRRFNIRGLQTPNDVAMLAEVLVRRFTKNTDWPKPDLVMLDGGRGQLSIVAQALKSNNISLPLIALAKKEELVYTPNHSAAIKLPTNSPGLLILQELRDEAHRFGITAYRRRHRQKNIASAWSSLPGVGPVLKRKLKNAFTSLNSIKLSPPDKLVQLVGPKKAKLILNHLNKLP
jgi:excinuclease ABC subunit C